VFPIGENLAPDRPSERQFTERKTRKTQTTDLGLTSNINIEGAVYDRAYFVDSAKNARSAKRKRGSAQPQEIDRAYSGPSPITKPAEAAR